MLWIVFGAFCHCPASKSTAVDFLHSSLSMGPCKIPADRFSKQTVQGECAPRSLKAGHHAPFCLRNAAPFSANTVHHSQRHAIHRSLAAVAASSGNGGKYPFSKIVFAFSVSHCFISSCCMAANAPQAPPAPSGEQAAHCRAQNPFFVVQRKGTAVLKAGNMLLSFCPKAPPRTPSVEQACALCQCMGRFAAP